VTALILPIGKYGGLIGQLALRPERGAGMKQVDVA
jgi:hypothetical protein